MGDYLVQDRVYWSYFVTVQVYDMPIDCIMLDMVDFYVIQDWLSPYHAAFDCFD